MKALALILCSLSSHAQEGYSIWAALDVDSKKMVSSSEIVRWAEDRLLTVEVRGGLAAASKDQADYEDRKNRVLSDSFNDMVKLRAWHEVLESEGSRRGMKIFAEVLTSEFGKT